MWSNFHTHSYYCDGKGELKDFVSQAKTSGIISLGFSSHAPLPFYTPWSMKSEQLADYLNTIEDLKLNSRGIELYSGLEVDYIPGVIGPHDYKQKLDFTIGSIHFLEQLSDGRRWEIDGSHTFFSKAIQRSLRKT